MRVAGLLGSGLTRKYFHQWRVTLSYSSGQFVGELFSSAFYPYVYIDPAYPQTDPNGNLPTQRLFYDTDYSTCTTAFGTSPSSNADNNGVGAFGCYPNTVYGGAISKSDWTPTATQVNVQASFNSDNYDHSGCGLWGSYHIYRKDYLLSGDASGASVAPNGAAHADCTGNTASDILIELGGGDNWNYSTGQFDSRWGSSDPTGDSQSRYMYMLMDMTPSYKSSANATRVQRSLLHFKESGTQDYVVSYDDVALSAPTQIQDWMMYWNHPASGTQVITATSSARTVVSKNTTVGNYMASSFFPVAGGNTVAMIATGVSGATNRQYLCPSVNGTSCNNSATSFEMIAVHKPSTNSNDSMSTISQDLCVATGGNCTVTEIMDSSSPKVAVFARQGALLTTASFITIHAGTAQYLIAGLLAGTYSVTVNGSTVASGVAVNAGDNTLYFESTSGSVVVTQGVASGAAAKLAFSVQPSPMWARAKSGSILSAAWNWRMAPSASFL